MLLSAMDRVKTKEVSSKGEQSNRKVFPRLWVGIDLSQASKRQSNAIV